MSQASPEPDKVYAPVNEPMEFNPSPAEPKDLSRLERLKLKIKKLGGRDPDIYPMF